MHDDSSAACSTVSGALGDAELLMGTAYQQGYLARRESVTNCNFLMLQWLYPSITATGQREMWGRRTGRRTPRIAALGTKDDSIVLFAKALTTTTARIKLATVLAKGDKAKGALFRNAAMRETRTIVAKGLAASLESTSTNHTKLRHAVRTVSNLLSCRAYRTPGGDTYIYRFGLAAVLAHIHFVAMRATTKCSRYRQHLIAILARHKQSTVATRTTATADALSSLVHSMPCSIFRIRATPWDSYLACKSGLLCIRHTATRIRK